MDLSKFKCGFISIIGKPNVGKSTIMNILLDEKLSIISPKPQTTRQNVKGILNDENKQIIFLDTPGFVQARYELHEKMLEYIRNSLEDSDIVLFVTDANNFPTDYDLEILHFLKKVKVPKFAIINKTDLVNRDIVKEKIEILSKENFDKIMPISAKEENIRETILKTVEYFLPFHPPFYATDEMSDLPMKFFVQELIRERIFHNYGDEIPYSSTVIVEHYKDLGNKVDIEATIWLERKTQKIIMIGKEGKKIKKMRIEAEKEIHSFVQKRVKLNLWIKIKANWRKKNNALKEFGY
jgi:GTP-binding protein Era